MRVLLDMHVFLWYVEDAPQMSSAMLEIINNGDNTIFVSLASAWEIAIKSGLGKLRLEGSLEPFMARQMKINNFEWLNISLAQISALQFLPQHHRDPFGRLLIAQAQTENLVLLSADSAMDAYPIERRW